MGNPATLQPKPFTSENQPPAHKKSRKGIPNRATVFKKWLNMKIKIDDPNAEDKDAPKLTVTMMEAAALGQIEAAMRGKTEAWKEIQDSLYGKQVDKLEQDVTQKVIVEFVNRDSNPNNSQDQG